MNDNVAKHLTVACLDLNKKLEGQLQQTERLKEEEKQSKQELEMLKKDRESLAKQVEKLTRDLNESKQEIEALMEDNRQTCLDLNKKLEEQLQQTERLKEEERQSKQELKMLKKDRKSLAKQVEKLTRDLNESKQEIETLMEDKRQLNVAQPEQDKEIQEQRRSTKQLEEKLKHFALSPFVFTFSSKKLLDISRLFSSVLTNEKPKTFGNLVDILREGYVFDFGGAEDCLLSHPNNDEVIVIWFVKDFKVKQQMQEADATRALVGPSFSAGVTRNTSSRVEFDPYGYEQSRGTHLSFSICNDIEGPNDDEIAFPHEQHFRVTIINLKDRENDISAEETFEIVIPKPLDYMNLYHNSRHSTRHYIQHALSLTDANEFALNDTFRESYISDEETFETFIPETLDCMYRHHNPMHSTRHYIHHVLSLTDANEFALNDTLILKMHVKYHSA